MKLTINIECTPVEARLFLGLPDFTSVNDVMVEGLKERVVDNIDTLTDPVKFWERAMLQSGQGMEAIQAAFAQAMKAQGQD